MLHRPGRGEVVPCLRQLLDDLPAFRLLQFIRIRVELLVVKRLMRIAARTVFDPIVAVLFEDVAELLLRPFAPGGVIVEFPPPFLQPHPVW